MSALDYGRTRRRSGSFGFERFATALLGCLLGACSQSDSGQALNGNSDLSVTVLDGFFRGGNVSGLRYVSGQVSGVTGATGVFSCEAGERVEFAVGAVTLGATACASIAHAAALSPTGRPDDPIALNITRFLMTLDQDENPFNGVSISGPLRSLAETWATVDFSASDFEPELTRILADITSAESRVAAVPDNAEAFEFLDAALSCAYSGVYVSGFRSGPFQTTTSVSVKIYRNRLLKADIGEFLLMRQEAVRPLFAVGQGIMPLATLPSIHSSDFTAEFTDPDRVAGGWNIAAGLQGEDNRGSFEATRLGEIGGEYRFAGTIDSSEISLWGSPIKARIALTLAGNTFSGESFENAVGIRQRVTGTRLPGSNDFELEIDALGAVTGTIIADALGEPIELRGDWPGLSGPAHDALHAFGCRLI